MKHIVKHQLSQELAKKACDKAAERYTAKFEKYNARATWVSDSRAEISFAYKGLHPKATLELQPGQLVLDMEVPLLLRPFKNMALGVIEEVIHKWIDKAQNGELD